MSVIQPTVSIPNKNSVRGVPSGPPTVQMAQWLAITDSDTCQGIPCSGFPDQTVEVSGTFGGATITLLGSNSSTDGTSGTGTWYTLTDPLGTGNAMSFTSNGMKTLLQNPLWIRPATANGSGSSLNVYLVSKAQSV